MNKKDYLKPTMKVVKLQHTGMLMASGEGMQAQRNSYGLAVEDDWE